VAAAVAGGVCVLDGVHRLPEGLLAAVLGPLLMDGELALADGTTLVSHPAFRVVAVAEPAATWCTAELLPMFTFHALPPYAEAELGELLASVRPAHGSWSPGGEAGGEANWCRPLARACVALRETVGDGRDGDGVQLSVRQALRVARRLEHRRAEVDQETFFKVFEGFCAGDVAGTDVAAEVARELEGALKHAGGKREAVRKLLARELGVRASDVGGGATEGARLGATTEPWESMAEVVRGRRAEARAELVPDGAFVPIPAHVAALRSMARDWAVGAHLLLVGTQVSRVATALMRWDPPAPTRRTGGGVDVTHSGTSPMWV
jgi:hypothetical protein